MKIFLIFILLVTSCSIRQNKIEPSIIEQNIKVQEEFLDIKTFAMMNTKGIEFCPDETISIQNEESKGSWSSQHKIFYKRSNEGIINYQEDGNVILYTFLQPTSTCKLFPVPKSEVSRVQYDLTIEIPHDWKILGFAKPELISGDKLTKTWNLRSQDAIPYMNLSFFAGTFNSFGMNPTYYYLGKKEPKDIEKILSEYKFIQRLVTDYFNFIPGPTYDLISIPNFEPGAMENYGAITVTDDLFSTAGKPADWEGIRKFVLLHESIHQIIGNCLSPKNKAQIFFVEGLTQFFANEISNGRNDFKNPFLGVLPRDYEIEVIDENIKLFFTKKSYLLGQSIFEKISNQKGKKYLVDKIINWYEANGCSQFDYSSLDPILSRQKFQSDL
jgi:Peptidase family M1 domain